MAATETALHDRVRAKAKARLEEIRRNRERYDSDFPTFAGDCLKIRPNEGADVLLRLNKVQRIVHARAEDQLRRTGMVRLLVLKARKPGVSTYVEARFYWKTSRQRGRRAFILTHDDGATDNLFQMAKRFHENNPHAPRTGKSNAKELSFIELDSSYGVGTAGNKAVGRSDTIQLFHGSEVAHWPNAEEHASGAMQAVPHVPGTEVWLESTANGTAGLFYNMSMAAMNKQNEYELVFVPWFEHEDYAMGSPADWVPPRAFLDYADLHRLNGDQLYWAWLKNGELAAAEGLSADELCWRFRQEYPATVEEAFRASRTGSFIPAETVLKARKWTAPPQDHAPLIIGCDFATGGDGEGGDANVFISRQGRCLGGLLYDRFIDKNTVSVANRLAKVIELHGPDMCFLDTGGGGAAVYDILKDRGYRDALTLVNFGEKATDDRRYANRRAEMWGLLRDWLQDAGGADVPDDEAFETEATAPTGKEDGNQRFLLEKKKDVRKKLGLSPDRADAAALTFAAPVRRKDGRWRAQSTSGVRDYDPHAWAQSTQPGRHGPQPTSSGAGGFSPHKW